MSRHNTVAVATLAALAAAVLGWGATRYGLHFVDLVGFSRRGAELAAGLPASDGLYPLGFPSLLALGHAAGLDVLTTARGLSVLFGVVLVALTGARLAPAAGLWLLVQSPLLSWATTEGTDLPATGLALGAVLTAAHPRVAGLLLGGALCLRWTAGAWVPAVLFAAEPGTRRTLAAFVIAGTAPHWLACAWCGTLVLPNQDMNLAMAAGPGAPPAAAGTLAALHRIPAGLGRALPQVLPNLVSHAGAALLALACVLPGVDRQARADRRLALALFIGGSLHTLALAAVFANPRLALPATLAAAMGLPVFLARLRPWGAPVVTMAGALCLVAAGWTGWRTLPALATPAPEVELVAALQSALALGDTPIVGPVMTNSALAHTEFDGWLQPGIQLGGLYVTPRTTPADLAAVADARGLTVLVLDPTRHRREHPGLAALYDARLTSVDGWRRRATGRWRVWERVR